MQIAFTLPMLNFRPKVNQNAARRAAGQRTVFPVRLKLHQRPLIGVNHDGHDSLDHRAAAASKNASAREEKGVAHQLSASREHEARQKSDGE